MYISLCMCPGVLYYVLMLVCSVGAVQPHLPHALRAEAPPVRHPAESPAAVPSLSSRVAVQRGPAGSRREQLLKAMLSGFFHPRTVREREDRDRQADRTTDDRASELASWKNLTG